MSWVTRLTALMPSIVEGTLMSFDTPVSMVSSRCRREIPGPVPGLRRRVATVTLKSARPAATAGNERGATGPREGPTVRLRPTSIDSTTGRLSEHPSWIVGLFRGDGIGHDGAGC